MSDLTTEAVRAHRMRARLATGYAARGWHVLPCRRRRPIIERWETESTVDPDEARAYWSREGDWAGMNIGLACGPSGIVVLDLDTKDGKDGPGALAALCAELQIELPETYTVRTPSGGLHLYFIAPRGVEIRLSQSAIAYGVDVRAWGGLIVAAGSQIDGIPYEVIKDLPLAEMPEPLTHRLANMSTTGRREKAGRIPDTIPQGERESQLVSMAGTMRRRGMSQDAIRAALEIENETRCEPPLETDDLDRIAGSVARYAPADEASADEIPDEIEIDPDLLQRTLVNLETQRVAAVMMRTRDTRRQREVLGGMATPLNVLQFITAGPDPTEVCIWGVPEKGGVMGWAANQGVIIAGPPGTGKSTIALQVILRRVGILEGTVLGMPVRVEKAPLVYLALDRADQIRQSVARMVPEDADPEAVDRLLMIDSLPPEIDLRQPATLISWLKTLDAKSVVMDSLKDLGFDLNDSGEGQALNLLVQALLRSGIQVFGLHHSRKVPRGDKKPLTLNDLHGSQWIAAGAGSVLMLDGVAGPDPKRLVHVKPLTVPMPPMQLALDPETGEVGHSDVDEEGEPEMRGALQERILEHLFLTGAPCSQSGLARELGAHSGSVSKAIGRLATAGKVTKNGNTVHLVVEEKVG